MITAWIDERKGLHMEGTHESSILVLSMPPWRFATRTRKGAREYARHGHRVSFLALQQVGRTGKRADSGTGVVEGVVAHHVRVRPPASEGSSRAKFGNVLRSYLPALARMTHVALQRPADIVHVTGVPLIPVAILHSLRHRSRLVLDINERPASVAAKDSLFSVTSRFEPFLIRAAAWRAIVVTVVAPGHARQLREQFGVAGAVVVRNSPEEAWRHGWQELPNPSPLKVVTVGSIFPGRALEMLIRATGIANARGASVALRIAGGGAPDYVQSLADLIEEEGLGDVVELEGHVDRSAVSRTYTQGHVGLALYESADPGNDSLSNKIIETVASGRPVLAGDLAENREFVTSLGVGWLTAVDDESIAQALTEIARVDNAGLRALARHCDLVASQSLVWEKEFEPVLSAVSKAVTTKTA